MLVESDDGEPVEVVLVNNENRYVDPAELFILMMVRWMFYFVPVSWFHMPLFYVLVWYAPWWASEAYVQSIDDWFVWFILFFWGDSLLWSFVIMYRQWYRKGAPRKWCIG